MAEMNYGYEQDNSQVTDQVTDMAKKAKDSVVDTARKATDKAQEVGRSAVGKIEEKRVAAAGALHNAATTIDAKADTLPSGPDLAHSAADKVHSMATYLEGHDTKQMMADMESIVKRNPGPSLLLAAAVGFLVARAFRND